MISDRAIVQIKHHEGVRLRPYRCPAQLWTVGVGHVLYPEQAKLPVDERRRYPLSLADNRTFSQEEVDAILKADLRRFEMGVRRLCPGGLSQPRLDALASFAFNVGLGSLQRSQIRMRHNRGDFDGAADGFLAWTKAAGKVLPGLVKRRHDERLLYLSPNFSEVLPDTVR